MGIEKVLYGFPVNTKLNSDLVSRVCGHLNIHSFRNGVCNELCRNSNSGRQFLFRGRYFTACKFKHDIFNKFKHQILHKSKEITNSKTIYRDFVPISHFDFQYFLDKYSIQTFSLTCSYLRIYVPSYRSYKYIYTHGHLDGSNSLAVTCLINLSLIFYRNNLLWKPVSIFDIFHCIICKQAFSFRFFLKKYDLVSTRIPKN